MEEEIEDRQEGTKPTNTGLKLAYRKLHAGRIKAESALLIQLRTGKIGFNEFLYHRKVPGFDSPRCGCDEGAMTVRHVILRCPRWEALRREELSAMRISDLQRLLGMRNGAAATVRMILKTGILK